MAPFLKSFPLLSMAEGVIPHFSIPKNPISRQKYQVFLSFRGTDTRHGFTASLYAKLKQMEIITFMDDQELKVGQPISPTLRKAIEESLISIVIISQNYASSTWCLNELEMIIESQRLNGGRIFPVFYDVKPRDVRRQKGTFAKAFAKHEKTFEKDKEKVQRWRNALTQVANLSGWEFKKYQDFTTKLEVYTMHGVAKLCGREFKPYRRTEAELIESIAEALGIMLRPKYRFIFDILNKIDSKLQEMNIRVGNALTDRRRMAKNLEIVQQMIQRQEVFPDGVLLVLTLIRLWNSIVT